MNNFPFDHDQIVNIMCGVACCLDLNIPFIIIPNEYGRLEESISRLMNSIVEIGKTKDAS